MTALALALALALPAADTTGGPHDPARTLITAEEIEAAGLYRLPDLFRLVPEARTATVEGLSWRAHLGGADPFAEEDWIVLLDGERLDLGLFGEQNLALVPVSITHLDSVEVWTTPRVAAGTFAAGVIHLHTRRPRPGPSLRAGFAVGNEAGDPGPFRYVPDLTSPNVDKFGPDHEAEIGYGARSWRAQARYGWTRFYATDPAAMERNTEALGGRYPALGVLAPAVRLEADALGGTHALSLLGSRADDLWFSAPVGRELPVRRLAGQASLSGRVPVAPSAHLAYRLALAGTRMEEWGETALGLEPGWRGRTMRAGMEGRWRRGALAASLGLDAEHLAARGAEGVALGRLTATLSRTPSPSAQQRLEASLAAAGGDVAASAALSARQTRGRLTLGAAASLAQRLPAEAARLGFWRARGYDAFGRLVDFEGDAAPGTTTQALARLDAEVRIAPGLAARAHAEARAFRGLTLETQPTAPDPDALEAVRRTFVVPGVRGQALGAGASLHLARGAWSGRLFYDGRAPSGGGDAFRRAWAAVPRHRAGASAAVTAGDAFTLWGSLAYRSSSRWPAFEGFEGYRPEVPAAWLLDAALEKALWQRRLRLSLLLRNVLDAEERYHPAGAELDVRLYLRAEVLLGR